MAGMNGFITKPINIEEVIRTLGKWIALLFNLRIRDNRGDREGLEGK